MKTLQNNGSEPSWAAHQRLETATRVCTDWLATFGISPTSTRNYSRGCLRSRLWEKTLRKKEDETRLPVLQLMLVPLSDGEPYPSGSRRCWQLWAYSWMDKPMTECLARVLRSTMTTGGRGLRLFLVTPRGIERL